MIKKTNKKNNTEKPVTKCDQSKEVVAKCDHPEEVITNSCLGKRPVGPSGDLQNINIESLIRIIRGQKVMFDSDFAMLYGVSTSRLNEQVKRNINRFPDDFMFQLSKDEWSTLRSQIVTLEDLTSQIAILKNGRGQHRKFMPYAFTRNGIGMKDGSVT